MTDVGGLLYFGGSAPGGGPGLWRSDGTAAGTFMVKELATPSDFVSYGGRTYFLADTGAGDRSLCVTDGTETGTALVKTGEFQFLTPAAGLLFAAGDDRATGTELWKSDGTTAGTVLVNDLFPGSYIEWFPDARPGHEGELVPVFHLNSSSPSNLTGETTLFFAATDADGTGLWRSDGTGAGTLKISPLSPMAGRDPALYPVLGYMASGPIQFQVEFQAPELGLAGSFVAGPNGGGWDSQTVYPRQLADVNGDGRADIVGFGAAGVYASLSTGDGRFASPTLALNAFGTDQSAGNWNSGTVYPRQLADVNGDGRADIVGFGAAGVYVALATSAGGFGSTSLALAAFGSDISAGGWTSGESYPRLLGDVNGDGRADVVGFGSDRVWVALATADGNFSAPAPSIQAFTSDPTAGGWTSNDLYPRELADVNGDFKADMSDSRAMASMSPWLREGTASRLRSKRLRGRLEPIRLPVGGRATTCTRASLRM